MAQSDSFDSIVHDLESQGYSVSEGLFSASHIADLARATRARQHAGMLVQSRTGKIRAENESLRGDMISWLDQHSPEASVVDCLAVFDALRLTLNEQLFMNLHELECHLALYPPGAGYDKHVDQFASGPQYRQLSMVLYLNDRWITANGGELRMYLNPAASGSAMNAGGHIDISPVGGRLVLFMSADFWHEVLPSSRDRISLTGWFRTRSLF